MKAHVRYNGEMKAEEWRIAVVGVVAGLCAVLVADQAAAVVGGPDDSVAAVVAGATLERDPSPEMVSLLRSATVKVRSEACGTLDGTGVILSSGLVLTNGHVLGGARSFLIETSDGQTHESGNATRPVATDLAAGIAPTGSEDEGLQLAADDPAAGDRVTVAGHADGGPLRVRTAEVEGAIVGTGRLDPPSVIRLDVVAVPGDSGSPVVDEDGRLVGLVYAAERNTRATLVIPVSELRRALLMMEPARQQC